MVQAVAGISVVASAAGALGVEATTLASVLLYAGTTAASVLLQMAMAPKEPETSTKLSARGGGAVPQSMIVGEKETAGSLIYAGTWGRASKTPNTFYVRVYCLSDVPSHDYNEVAWFSGTRGTFNKSVNSYTDADTGTSGEIMGHPVPTFDHDGNHYVWVKILNGDQTVADPYLREVFGGLSDRPWLSDMIGRGRTLMIVTQRFSVKDSNSVHDVAAVIKGAKFYDWREDSENGGRPDGTHRWGAYDTYEYTANPIVIAYNIMRGIYRGNVENSANWLYGGLNWPARRFDYDTWTAAANACDEDVDKKDGLREPRFRMGAEIGFDEEPLTVIDRILATCGGRLVESGGIYKVYAGGVGASVYSFTDRDIVITEALSGTMFPSREDICNTITGSYIEPDNGGQTKAYRKRFKNEYITEDSNEVRAREMSFDYVRSNRQAQRLALHALKDNRRFMTKVVAFPSIGRKLEPGDIVNWSSSKRFGFINKKFLVGDVTIANTGIVIAMLREVDATDSDWNPAEDEDDYSVGVYGDIVAATQTFVATVSAINIKNNAGNNKRPGIRIAATVSADDVDCDALLWRVRLASSPFTIVARGRDDDFFDLGNGTTDISHSSFLPDEDYQVSYKIKPLSDRETRWSNWEDGEITLTPTRLKIQEIGGDAGDINAVDTDNLVNNAVKRAKVNDAEINKAKIDKDSVLQKVSQQRSITFANGDTGDAERTVGDPWKIVNDNPSPVLVFLDNLHVDATIWGGSAQGGSTTVRISVENADSGVEIGFVSVTAETTDNNVKSASKSVTGMFLDFNPSASENTYRVRARMTGGGAPDHSGEAGGTVRMMWWGR